MPEIQPAVVEREEQLYAFIRGSVRMNAFASIANRLPELVAWLTGHGAEFNGAPFFRFNAIDMEGESEVEAGVPVIAAPEPEGDIRIAMLPAGRYVTAVHVGHPDKLFGTITELRRWAEREGLEWDMTVVDGVERWGCRVESYLTDPRVEPEMSKWKIGLAFRLAH